jgi:mRNA interferase RelE/StbE
LRQLPKETIAKLLKLAESLIENPFPKNYKKSLGTKDTYRVRSGDYRIIYSINNGELIIQIIRIRHRREVYK